MNVIIVFCILLFTSYIAKSQTCCSAGAPISSSFSISNNGAKSLTFSLDYIYTSVNRLVSNNEILQNDSRSRFGQYILLKADYAISDRWSVSTIIPYIYQSRSTFSQSEFISSIGDLTILGQYDIVIKRLSITGGLQFPTGSTLGVNASKIIASPDMQSGSGTMDYILNINWNKNHFLIPNFRQNLSLSYKRNGTNKHFGDPSGKQGRRFKFGNELTTNINWGYLLLLDTWFIIPTVGINYNNNSNNEEEGAAANNSGGHWINIPLEIQFQPGEKLVIGLNTSLPIYQNLNGLQITTDYSLGLSFTYILQ